MEPFNLDRAELAGIDDGPEGVAAPDADLGAAIGGRHLGGRLVELPPGGRAGPDHWHAAQEAWLVVLARHADGPGAAGAAGARRRRRRVTGRPVAPSPRGSDARVTPPVRSAAWTRRGLKQTPKGLALRTVGAAAPLDGLVRPASSPARTAARPRRPPPTPGATSRARRPGPDQRLRRAARLRCGAADRRDQPRLSADEDGRVPQRRVDRNLAAAGERPLRPDVLPAAGGQRQRGARLPRREGGRDENVAPQREGVGDVVEGGI